MQSIETPRPEQETTPFARPAAAGQSASEHAAAAPGGVSALADAGGQARADRAAPSQRERAASVLSHWADPGSAGALPPSTQAKMEAAFGQSFGGVKVNPASARASGSVQALAQGEELHFAPGQFRPGSAEGDWLIAHELSHVVQQRGQGRHPQKAVAQAFAPGEERGALERDADQAADRASSGRSATVQLSAASGMVQHYEWWEHHKLGEQGGGGRVIMTHSGVALTYGQMVALSGDFYGSPEAVMNAPKAELERLLKIAMNEEAQAARSPSGRPTDAELDGNTSAYESATKWRERTHYDANGNDTGKTEGETKGVGSQSFLSLAANNSSHFSPENINSNWLPHHGKALTLASDHHKEKGAAPRSPAKAKQTHAAATGQSPAQGSGSTSQTSGTSAGPAAIPNPTSAEDKFNLALMEDGFACHFLTDAFASGHLISGDVGRKVGRTFWQSHQSQIRSALLSAANADFPHVPHQVVDKAIDQIIGLSPFQEKVDSITLKLVHDKLNATKLKVGNRRGDAWETTGDGHMASAPDTPKYAAEAVKLSREAVEETAQSGSAKNPHRALELVPSNVLFDGKSLTIAQFGESPTIFEGLLAPLLLDRSVANPLYQKIRSNIGLLGDLVENKTIDGTRAAKSFGKRQIHKVEDLGERTVEGAEELGHRVVNKAEDLGHRAIDKAEDLGRRGIHKAEEVGHQVVNTGERAIHKAEDLGHRAIDKAEDLGRRGIHKAEEVGHQVVNTGERAVHKAEDLGHRAIDGAEDLGRRGIHKAEDLGHQAVHTGARGLHKAEEFGQHTIHNVDELVHQAANKGAELKHSAEEKAGEIGHGAQALGRKTVKGATDLGHQAQEKLASWTDGWL